MSFRNASRKPNDYLWHTQGIKYRVVKYVILNHPTELNSWYDKMHKCRVKLNKLVYRDVKSGLTIDDMVMTPLPHWKELMNSYGFDSSKYYRSLQAQVLEPYMSGKGRNKRLAKRPVNKKEFGAVKFNDNSNSIAINLTPNKYKGQINLLLTGKLKDRKYIGLDYYIPKYYRQYVEFINSAFSGNFKCFFRHYKKHFEYHVKATVPIVWSYVPKRVISFDIGKRSDAYLAFNTDEINGSYIWEQTQELKDITKELKSINKNIDNNNKTGNKTTKIRNKDRLKWKRLQNKQSNIIFTQYIQPIIDFAIKNECLICIDDITTGKTNGEFGQKIVALLKRSCENQSVPFTTVPSYHTTARCNKCGYIHDKKDVELYRPTIDKFVCQQCGHKEHADINAANNIAIFGYNIWLHGEKPHKDTNGNILEYGLAHRKRNNSLINIP